MEYICIEFVETGERRRIEDPVWITGNRNGILRTTHRAKALGVGDGEQVFSFGELEGFPVVKEIALSAWMEHQGEIDPDPELSAEEALYIIMGGKV